MNPRRALAFLALGIALIAAKAALLAPPRAALDPAAMAPREMAPATLFLGGFRAIVADALWVRLIERYDAGDYEEVPPLAEALVALDPRFEQAWFVASWTLAVDLPALEREEARWPWVRQGLLLIRDGARRNPASWFLRFHEGFLAWQHVARDPALSHRFLADAEANPEGVAAAEYARRRFAEAAALPGHPIYVDWAVIRASLATGRRDAARAALAHVRAAHPGAHPDQLAEFERRVEQP